MEFVIFLCMVALSYGADKISTKRFPGKDKLMLGVATASFQIEGGWNADGKSENVWDHYLHNHPNQVRDHNNADVSCDSYHKIDDDIAMLTELGVDHYRFSLSWSRLLPTGYYNKVNKYGVDYYNKLIDKLVENKIQPLVTLFHWDTPQVLEELGGFQNEIIIDLYAEYARLCFKLFGDRVKYWLTFNEPKQTCHEGYGIAGKAPMKKSEGLGEYMCVHNVVRAHSKAWHIYDKEFRKDQKGLVGITLDTASLFPANASSQADIDAVERTQQFILGYYANPLYHGDYPEVMRKMIDEKSKAQGFKTSRLPRFTEEEKRRNKGTLDFLGLNCYSRYLAAELTNQNGMGLNADSDTTQYQPEEWEKSASSWLKVTPPACAEIIEAAQKLYNPSKIFITENGYSDSTGELNDDKRIQFYQHYLTYIQKAMDKGVNLIGYTAWTLMDNFEWFGGYTERFGLYHTDFNDPNRTRTPKKSAKWYKKFIATRCLVDKCDN